MVPMALALTSTLRLGSIVPEQSTMAVRSFAATFPVSTRASALSRPLRMDATTAPSTSTIATMIRIRFTMLLPGSSDYMKSMDRPSGMRLSSAHGSTTDVMAALRVNPNTREKPMTSTNRPHQVRKSP
jgi:hypothetical protein